MTQRKRYSSLTLLPEWISHNIHWIDNGYSRYVALTLRQITYKYQIDTIASWATSRPLIDTGRRRYSDAPKINTPGELPISTNLPVWI